ncbi:MAG: T9SS type A sorting domain-containing protein [candidate division WOR-3 bacterium]|nr:T9SS type A sorting domain-containing protein [candidate division WOR-3 bacterium]
MKRLLLFLPIILYAQVIDTVIPLYDQPRERLFYIPEGNKLYINLDRSRRLLVLDCSTYSIRKIIQIPPSFPCAAYAVWNPRRNKIYYIFNEGPDSIAVIDNRTDSIIKWINFYSPAPPCYNSKDDKVYVTNGMSVAVIDCETDSIIKIIPPQPNYLGGFVMWDSIGNKVYCGSLPDKVIAINCTNDSVIAVISTGVSSPYDAVHNAERRKIYVAGASGRNGAVIDAIGDTLIKNIYPISFFADCQSLIWNRYEDKIYWPGWYGLYIIDCQTDTIIKTINTSLVFDGLRLAHLRNRLYIASIDTASPGYYDIILKILDCYNDSVVSQIRFGGLGMGMEYDPRNQRIYIGDVIDSALYVIRDEIPGIEEIASLPLAMTNGIEIYPNPARSFLAIHLPLSTERQSNLGGLKIFDVSGKMVKEIATPLARNDEMGEAKISLKEINPGIYFLRLNKETKKFLVVK